MFRKPTKRQFIIRRIILSSIATLSVIIIATVTILFMLGYRLDSGNGRLEQGALLQFDSTPNGADVFVDGKNIGSRTATKQAVIAGTHTVKMSKTGYKDWTRTLTLTAGTLTWLDYTRLVPTDLTAQTLTTYPALASAKFSVDDKWALLQQDANLPQFQLIDLRSEEIKTTTLDLPTTSYTVPTPLGTPQSFSVMSWDTGSRYALVKHLYNDQTEWLVLDTQNSAQTTSITKLLSVGFKDLQFASTNGKILYGLTDDGTIRKVDLSAATISRAFVSHVESFSLYDNMTVSYVGVDPSDASKRVAGVYRDGDESSHILHSIATPETVLKIVTSRYFSDDFVAIAEGNVVTVLKGSYPLSSSQDTSSLKPLTTFELSGAVSALSFSPKGDYVLAQSGENYKSYEIEHDRQAVSMIAVETGKVASTLKWLSTAQLWNDDGGSLTMRDFEGSNVFSIMSVEPGFDSSLSQNGRFFYGISKNETGYHLQRVKMILE